ncbi:MAG: hypothetical protein PGN20_12550 [Agrobacterium cavarae]
MRHRYRIHRRPRRCGRPGGLARSFAKIERNLIASAPSITQGEQVDIERKAAIASLDFYFQRFDQFEKLR